MKLETRYSETDGGWFVIDEAGWRYTKRRSRTRLGAVLALLSACARLLRQIEADEAD